MDAEVLSLHPRWCHGDSLDETRMRNALEVDPQSVARLHYVNFFRLSFPLLSAVVSGHMRCARLLAEAEVKLERRRIVKGVPAIARALVHGKKSHALETVKLLLEYGANPNYIGSRGPRTSYLHLAVKFELPQVILALLESGAQTEDWGCVKSYPGPTCTPLLQACTLLHLELLRILLHYGASPNPQNMVTDESVPSPANVVVQSCLKREGEKQDVCIAILNLLHEHGSNIWRRNTSEDERTSQVCAQKLPELHSALEKLTCNPTSLQHLCKAKIRHKVKPRYIDTLNLPKPIKLYLLE